jgi:hypothetical protein
MKSKYVALIVTLNSALLIWITLLTNQVQTSCVSAGKIGPGELSKISLTQFTYNQDNSLKESMITSHAVAGGILLLTSISILSSCTIIILNRKKK